MRGSECTDQRAITGKWTRRRKGEVVMKVGVITSFLIHILSLSSPTRSLFQEHFEFVSLWLPTQTILLWHLQTSNARDRKTFFFFFSPAQEFFFLIILFLYSVNFSDTKMNTCDGAAFLATWSPLVFRHGFHFVLQECPQSPVCLRLENIYK